MLPLPTKECVYCDYTFTSKSMVVNAQTASAESYFIQNKFPFEPDRVSTPHCRPVGDGTRLTLCVAELFLRRKTDR